MQLSIFVEVEVPFKKDCLLIHLKFFVLLKCQWLGYYSCFHMDQCMSMNIDCYSLELVVVSSEKLYLVA